MPHDHARGKWLFCGDDKFLVKGVTYGTFAPDENGHQFPAGPVLESDFRAMRAAGFNTIRTYTVPTPRLLDLAGENALRVLVGLPWEQHTTFLDRRGAAREILKSVRKSVDGIAGHEAILGFAVGNEIPAPIVRWHGADAVQNFIQKLYDQVKSADPEALVTYVNYPTTEYLRFPFLDFHAFNVFLEDQKKLADYLAHLHNTIGDKPLLLTEVGLDSRRNGLETQAASLSWQLRTAFHGGCAGACVFKWTDEWWRGGFDVPDWDFGLVDRDRNPKPALAAASAVMAESPIDSEARRPMVSIVVATRNGAATIEDTLTGIDQLDYPNYEVLVIDDGSTDNTVEIARRHDVRVIACEGRGLSDGRNTGLKHAAGEIIAYIDDDAYPDPDWLTYLVQMYETTEHAAVGGPNVIPDDSGLIAHCVANAPGGPVHVLFDDRTAEHIPGCNMTFRKSALEAIGGFDSRFIAAGDDVDVCWRIQEVGWTIGFHPSALVWHYRRNSLRAYWKQQKGYGKAEALLERKWPERYNRIGHVGWAGHIYGPGVTESLVDRDVIYQGVWGASPFQSIYMKRSSGLGALPLVPEWLLLVALLGILSLLGTMWAPLLATLPFFVIALSLPVLQAVKSSRKADFPSRVGFVKRSLLRVVVGVLHFIQPLGRLKGRIGHGLTLWRRRGLTGFAGASSGSWHCWSTSWKAGTEWIVMIEGYLLGVGAPCRRGNAFSNWDIEVRGGLLASTRLLTTVEEHGAGQQLIRARFSPYYSRSVPLLLLLLSLTLIWGVTHATPVFMIAAEVLLLMVLGRAVYESFRSAGAIHVALEAVKRAIESDLSAAVPETAEAWVEGETPNRVNGNHRGDLNGGAGPSGDGASGGDVAPGVAVRKADGTWLVGKSVEVEIRPRPRGPTEV